MTNSKLIYIEDDQILGNLITQALVDYGFEIASREFGFHAAGLTDIGY